jgi:hypothetical protein
MSAESKAWIKAEQRRGLRTALLPAGFGAAQILAALGQMFCAAHLLAAVLLPGLRHAELIALDIAGYAIFALARACWPSARPPIAAAKGGIRRNWLRLRSTAWKRWRVSTRAGFPPPFSPCSAP